jgi:hypothetical protein
MNFEPKVNDYVKWENGKDVEGWVYFKCEQYITIETSVRPKHKDDLKVSSLHKNDRVLVLCYQFQWKELDYIRSRKSIYEK